MALSPVGEAFARVKTREVLRRSNFGQLALRKREMDARQQAEEDRVATTRMAYLAKLADSPGFAWNATDDEKQRVYTAHNLYSESLGLPPRSNWTTRDQMLSVMLNKGALAIGKGDIRAEQLPSLLRAGLPGGYDYRDVAQNALLQEEFAAEQQEAEARAEGGSPDLVPKGADKENAKGGDTPTSTGAWIDDKLIEWGRQYEPDPLEPKDAVTQLNAALDDAYKSPVLTDADLDNLVWLSMQTGNLPDTPVSRAQVRQSFAVSHAAKRAEKRQEAYGVALDAAVEAAGEDASFGDIAGAVPQLYRVLTGEDMSVELRAKLTKDVGTRLDQRRKEAEEERKDEESESLIQRREDTTQAAKDALAEATRHHKATEGTAARRESRLASNAGNTKTPKPAEVEQKKRAVGDWFSNKPWKNMRSKGSDDGYTDVQVANQLRDARKDYDWLVGNGIEPGNPRPGDSQDEGLPSDHKSWGENFSRLPGKWRAVAMQSRANGRSDAWIANQLRLVGVTWENNRWNPFD